MLPGTTDLRALSTLRSAMFPPLPPSFWRKKNNSSQNLYDDRCYLYVASDFATHSAPLPLRNTRNIGVAALVHTSTWLPSNVDEGVRGVMAGTADTPPAQACPRPSATQRCPPPSGLIECEGRRRVGRTVKWGEGYRGPSPSPNQPIPYINIYLSLIHI